MTRVSVVSGFLLLVGTLAALFLIHRWDPTAGNYPPCPLHYLTGLHCPGCGTTRALHRLTHGDLLGALKHNPLMVIALPCLAHDAARRLAFAWRQQPYVEAVYLRRWGALIACTVMGFGVVRNIPCSPFDWLAPPPPVLARHP